MKPWMKWYPTDWRADPALRMCSLAARGLWIELIGYMHEAVPYGHLLIGNKVPTTAQLASLVGSDVESVAAALAELEDVGVCSRDRHGRIFSRRMVRDHDKAAVDRANGKLGGNPQLRRKTSESISTPSSERHGTRASDADQRTPGAVDDAGAAAGRQPDVAKSNEALAQDGGWSWPETVSPVTMETLHVRAPPAHRSSGTRLPDDWDLPAEWRAWVRQEKPPWSEADIDRVALKFRNYWTAKAGVQATKRSWERTWQNWVLDEREQSSSRRAPSLAERRARNMDILTGRIRDERTVEGVSQRMGSAVVLALQRDLREPDSRDVGRPEPGATATGVG
jgi:hypothetical protein